MGEKSTHNQALNAERASAGFFEVFSSHRKRRWLPLSTFVAWHRQVILGVIRASEKADEQVCFSGPAGGEPLCLLAFRPKAKAISKAAGKAA